MSRAPICMIQIAVLVVLVPVVLVGAYVIGNGGDADKPTDAIDVIRADGATEFQHDYVIPAGTAARIEAGEAIEVVPAELLVEVGDALRIVNEDDTDHIVGVFFVAAGGTITQRFNSPAVLEGRCSMHPSGAFTLRVVEDLDEA